MTYPDVFYEPFNGVHPGMTPPTNLGWRYPDTDVPLMVYIAVSAYPTPSEPCPRDRQWSLLWEQGVAIRGCQMITVARFLEARQAAGCEHYTYWGPVTRAASLEGARLIPVATLSMADRRALEKLAGGIRVMKPNGWWNCQNWVVQLLRRAADEDIITAKERDTAIYSAAEP
ncbi:hypothetical protein BV25DRAFT_1822284 [Artomyces pyxidatus]|uniref:Uncharacterized protein n=1 Tax=Artomyces pyxidatus TaxID=48021 RepID=A0ACB8T9G8_9AGAM|nr:hypothetical protein BV25DRAFT_1822284 [Artomyces pyxidatus]